MLTGVDQEKFLSSTLRHARLTTIEFSGTRLIPLKSTGREKSRGTVVLAPKASGHMFPQFIAFKALRRDWEFNSINEASNMWQKLGGNWLFA